MRDYNDWLKDIERKKKKAKKRKEAKNGSKIK